MKKQDNKKRVLISLLIAFLILVSINHVYAFGISSPYMENKQLNLYPGAIKDLEFVLQNGGGATEDVKIKIEIINGSEIASITDSEDIYLVPAGGRAISNIRISIPETATDKYTVKIGFSTVTERTSSTFSFGSRIDQSFDVIVGEKPVPSPQPSPEQLEETKKSSNKGLVYLLIGIIILLLIISLTIRKMAKSSS